MFHQLCSVGWAKFTFHFRKTDFKKYFTNKLENWEGGSGFKSIIGLDYLKQVLTGCKLLLPGSELAKRLRLEGAGQFKQHVLMYE